MTTTVVRAGQPCRCCPAGWVNPPAAWAFPTLEAAARFAARATTDAPWATITIEEQP